jgi:hypothetical protein
MLDFCFDYQKYNVIGTYYRYYNQCIKISKEIEKDKDASRELDLLEIESGF